MHCLLQRRFTVLANTSFLTMFPFCTDRSRSAGGLDKAYLLDASVDERERTITMRVHFASAPSLTDLGALEEQIRTEFALSRCSIQAEFPAPEVNESTAASPPAPAGQSGQTGQPKAAVPTGKILMGRPLRLKTVPMNTLTLESGKVAVEGDVIAVTSRTLAKRGSAILCFDITDRTNSIRISKFLRESDDQSIIEAISMEMWSIPNMMMTW